VKKGKKKPVQESREERPFLAVEKRKKKDKEIEENEKKKRKERSSLQAIRRRFPKEAGMLLEIQRCTFKDYEEVIGTCCYVQTPKVLFI